MSKKPAHTVSSRRIRLIALITNNPLSAEEIVDQLRPRIGKRRLHQDIVWLMETFPTQFLKESARGLHGGSRVTFRWVGEAPFVLSRPLHWMTAEELIALVCARGMLRNPDPLQPNVTTAVAEHDLLPTAVGRLLDRAGLQSQAEVLAREVVTVSRFGATSADPACLNACLTATANGEALEFDYVGLDGRKARRTVRPLRVVLIKGEWYCLACNKELKKYRISRMSKASRCHNDSVRVPLNFTTAHVDKLLNQLFYATGSDHPKDHCTVILGVSPEAWPHLCERRWGDNLQVDHAPDDLPQGWRRLQFDTTGLAECRHWVLGMGATVRAEGPAPLVEWIRSEAKRVFSSLTQGQPIAG